jgi:DNA (cytosine-5)-methyltransferase 1
MSIQRFSSLEICAGGGGQALGLDLAGFDHVGAVEIDKASCETLRLNRPQWNVIETDVRELRGAEYRGVDLVAGGVPCPPFSVAGKQLGNEDERDLFPTALRLIQEAKPAAVMLENVSGLATAKFLSYRRAIALKLTRWGYSVDWQVLNACNFGVPQLRPRFVLVALKRQWGTSFAWPQPVGSPPTVGSVLYDLMASRGWRGATQWADRARAIAPTLVGGSKKHGGPDLGPTRARRAWRDLGVEAISLSDAPPDSTFPADALPRLTVRMTARIQGFPDAWAFFGKKTAAYRQIGNAFPPPVALAVGTAIYGALAGTTHRSNAESRRLTLEA